MVAEIHTLTSYYLSICVQSAVSYCVYYLSLWFPYDCPFAHTFKLAVVILVEYVGEDKNLNGCWRSMLVTTFLYVGIFTHNFITLHS